MPNIFLQLNKNEIDLIREISTTWFEMEGVSGEWISNWEAAVKIYYRSESWSENKFVDIDEDIIDDFKDCIQDYVSQGFKNEIGAKKFNIGKFLFIKILDLLQFDDPPGLFIPLSYEGEEAARKIIVNPANHPFIELAKHGIYIKNGEN